MRARCSRRGCDSLVVGRGLCRLHYARTRSAKILSGEWNPRPVRYEAPCGVCGAKTLARKSDRGLLYRACANGHSTVWKRTTSGLEFVRKALSYTDRTKHPPNCPCGRKRVQGIRFCSACDKRRARRTMRVFRASHPCGACGSDTASTHTNAQRDGTNHVIRECRGGHRSYWSNAGRDFVRLVGRPGRPKA